jgi:hypothetical protein
MRADTVKSAGRPSRQPTGPTPTLSVGAAAQVAGILRAYAERGMFRGYAEKPTRGGKHTFSVLWHYNRQYPFVLDLAADRLSFPGLLPGIAARSPMATELKEFLRPFSTGEVPAHRRIDSALGQLALKSQQGALTLGMTVIGGEYEYCTRKLVHVAHEIFMVFLWDGPYYDYRVEKLGLDPDAAWP